MEWAAERTPMRLESGDEAVSRGPAGRFQPDAWGQTLRLHVILPFLRYRESQEPQGPASETKTRCLAFDGLVRRSGSMSH